MKKTMFATSVTLCLILLSTSVSAWGNRVTVQTVYVTIAYHQNFSFTVSGSAVSQNSNSRLIIRNLDLDNPLTVTSIRMFDPYGIPVTEFDCVVSRINLPITLEGGETMTLGVANPVFGPCGDPGLYHFTEGRPYLIVKWESNDRVFKPKIGATIFNLRFKDQRAPGMQSSGPELYNEYYQDGVVLEQTWGMGRH